MSELLSVIDESKDQEITTLIRAAIVESGDREAIQTIMEREPKYPNLPDKATFITVRGETLGPFFTMQEHRLKDSSTWIRHEMTKVHDRVIKLRNIVPRKPKPESWWRRLIKWA